MCVCFMRLRGFFFVFQSSNGFFLYRVTIWVSVSSICHMVHSYIHIQSCNLKTNNPFTSDARMNLVLYNFQDNNKFLT